MQANAGSNVGVKLAAAAMARFTTIRAEAPVRRKTFLP